MYLQVRTKYVNGRVPTYLDTYGRYVGTT